MPPLKSKGFPDLEINLILDHARFVEMILRRKSYHDHLRYKRLEKPKLNSADDNSYTIKTSSIAEYTVHSEITYEIRNYQWVPVGHVFLHFVESPTAESKYTLIPLSDGTYAIQQSYRENTNLPAYIHGKSWSDSKIIDAHTHHALLSQRKNK